jgi:outer membrane protein OmpA-like peptidoglycan-associated protein
MGKRHHTGFSAILAVAIAAVLAGPAGLLQPAQAQRWEQQGNQRWEQQQRQQQQQQQQQRQQPAPRPAPPPSVSKPIQQAPPRTQLQRQQQPDNRPKQYQQGQPPAAKLPPARPAPDVKQERFKRMPPPGQQPPAQQGVAPPPKGPPPGWQKAPAPKDASPGWQKAPVAKPPSQPTGPATVSPRPQGPGLKRLEDVRKARIERVEDGGRLKVIQEPGNRYIIRQNNRIVVRSDEAERFRRRPGAKSEKRGDGNVETSYERRDGVRIVTVVDGHGRLLRRYRRHRDGREHNIIDNRRFYRGVAVGVGVAALGIIALNLPPPHVNIPEEQYNVDYDDASDDDLYETLDAPPIEDLERSYSLDEIRDNYELRARLRSINIDGINFDFGSWEIPPDQHWKLERIARAILRVLDRNPDAVFLIAGHTDAVGSEEDNASLSARRATAVAEVLADQFGVPDENLVTQGYGEQHLKIDTQEPEPRNRRVSVQNITRLMAER